MKKIGILTVLVFILLVGFTLAQDELKPGLALVIKEGDLKTEASFSGDTLATLEAGVLVTVIETDRRYALVEYDGVEGWIQTSSLVNASGPSPLPRGFHHMTYDVESGQIILFGGTLREGTLINDTWSYEVATNSWTKMAPVQSPPGGDGTLAYDSQSDRVILFLGTINHNTSGSSETWVYDFNTDSWTNIMPSLAPPLLWGARMVYDEESDRMILFGGARPREVLFSQPAVFPNETWSYDLDSNTWTQMNPVVSPPGMYHPAMAYDTGADRVILIGSNPSERVDDTWLYDYNTDNWEMRTPADGPGPRSHSAMVYANGIGQVILFGGEETEPEDEIWSYDFNAFTWSYDFDSNTWTLLEPETSPSSRGLHAMAYSDAAEQIILFGGGESLRNAILETWVYDPDANTWTQVGP